MHRKLITLAAVAAAVAAIAGVGYAAIPGSDGAISACKDNKGALKVIDAEGGATCPNNQQLLTWNQQGPQGPPGLSGVTIVTSTPSISSGSTRSAHAVCPPGTKVIGGGAKAFTSNGSGEFNTTGLVALAQSYPEGETGWAAYANETTATDLNWALRAYAICATVE